MLNDFKNHKRRQGGRIWRRASETPAAFAFFKPPKII